MELKRRRLQVSGDGFTIRVHTNDTETLDRKADGLCGVTTAPGAAAVIGRVPSQDELAGFLAGVVAGGALPGGGKHGPDGGWRRRGQVLAMGTAAELLAEWQDLVLANGMATPDLDVPGQPALLNATETAA